MTAVTICQPYPHLIMLGLKPIENRTWSTNYRGWLVIHAGRSRDWLGCGDETLYPDMAFGAIVGVAKLVACLPKRRTIDVEQWGGWSHLFDHEHANGPWCWVLEDVRRFAQPIPCRGYQQLWHVPAELTPQVIEAARRKAA